MKKFRPTESKEKILARENILKKYFYKKIVNEKWVGDITYINTLNLGWRYLISVINLHAKKIVSYSFGCSMMTELLIKVL